tara:strand:- start:103 stop:921 length:819 start_codon:yes stop_codon:yes gene_type:complete
MKTSNWSLPENDPWSTPFAQALLHHLDLFPGATVLDVASGVGIPAFYIAEQVGPKGRIFSVDINPRSILRAKTIQGPDLPWLEFMLGDLRELPQSLTTFDRITGNLSFMFFRPNRFKVLQQLVSLLKPKGQIVLTFPSLGTFDSLFRKVDQEMENRGLVQERKALAEYIEERPSAKQARKWLQELSLEKITVTEWPLEVASQPGRDFLEHPLLRGGFLDDIYECFKDQNLAEEFMTAISKSLPTFQPLLAQRCAMSAWTVGKTFSKPFSSNE